MITWIVIGAIFYFLIGAGILLYGMKTDPWGFLLLYAAIPLILFWPFFIARSWFVR